MAQLNNDSGNILVEKYANHDGKRSWTTVQMSELHTNDIFRMGGRHGRVFKAMSEPTEGPIAEGVWQVVVEEIAFEAWS